ncbi:MAG: serine/threonine-protein phosphatase 6 regulatory ankyrin repeat subunit B [Faunusvirus sp.]|jgi:ankyrin repeat protein|uniref:Serine/threonine-protein phosphatase 6 regulatory ankyrin repeat subunit B n=1 Tax=Faunusvirus sp. TaxID=2487766 RepID=A0A3G4ZZ95_9VIRU|nr:MAG: serine/threonine-protein phosphatase 6 regulatory ankyrin repeat subunit B [Faunusvirus sp.]
MDLLFSAIEKGDEAELLCFINELGLDVNEKYNGVPMLTHAITTRNPLVVDILLKHGAKTDDTTIFSACSTNSIDIVKLVLDYKANINALQPTTKCNALFAVSENKLISEDILTLLIDRGIDVEHVNRDGYSCGIYIIHFSRVNAVKKLIEKKVDLFKKCPAQNQSPFDYAMRNGNRDIIDLILETSDMSKMEKSALQTLMATAITNKNTVLLDKILKHKIDINTVDYRGFTPLMIAINNRSPIEIIYLLIAAGADINIASTSGTTALMLAAQYNNLILVKHFIEVKLVDVTVKNTKEQTVYDLAITGVAIDVIKYFLDTNRITIEHKSLIETVMSSQVLREYVFSKGVDVNYVLSSGKPLLVHTIEHNYVEATAYLLERGANVAACKKYNIINTLCINGQTDLLDKLLAKDAKDIDINIKDSDGYTPLMNMCRNLSPGYVLITKKLLAHKADINAQSPEKITALHFAIMNNDAAMAKMLLDNGALMSISSTEYGKPIELAIRYKYYEIVKLLVERGEDINYITGAMISSVIDGIISETKVKPIYEDDDDHEEREDDEDKQNKITKNLDFFKFMISKSLKLSDLIVDDKPLLVYAITKKSSVLTALLLENGVDVNTKWKSKSILMWLCQMTGLDLDAKLYTKIVEKSDINEMDDDKNTILHLAVGMGNAGMVKYLITSKDTDICRKNKQGESAILLALRNNYRDVVELFSNYLTENNVPNANDAVDMDGNTPMMHACKNGISWFVNKYITKDNITDSNKIGESVIILLYKHDMVLEKKIKRLIKRVTKFKYNITTDMCVVCTDMAPNEIFHSCSIGHNYHVNCLVDYWKRFKSTAQCEVCVNKIDAFTKHKNGAKFHKIADKSTDKSIDKSTDKTDVKTQ